MTYSSSKKIKVSRRLQELAAELMIVNDRINALRLYNRSIAVSPVNTVDLPIAYANKSAVLLEMKNYDWSMQNINLALRHSLCPSWLISPLLERKVKCLLLMGKWNELNEKKLFRLIKRLPFSNHEKNIFRSRLDQYLIDTYDVIKNTEEKKCKIEKYANNFRKIQKLSNSKDCNLLNFNERIQIVENSMFGRHILAKVDIDMGDLIIKERPVVSCLYQNEVYEYCSCCLIQTEVLVPCDFCSKSLFCSRECLLKAFNQYHRIECPLMNYFSLLKPDEQHVQYILRLICCLSEQGRKLEDLVDKWNELKNQKKTFCPLTKPYQIPDDFRLLFPTFEKYKYQPVQYAHSQTRFTNLVEELKSKTEFFIYVGNTVYEHYFEFMIVDLLIDLETYFKCNTFCVSNSLYSLDEMSIMRRNIGLACYRESNFFNHSCVPNVAYVFENGDTVATYSLRKIKAGEQLFICYLNTYYEVEKSKRDLLKSYSFQCTCVACLENWPPYNQIQSVYDIRFCECSHHDALARRVSITGCSFCRFKRDIAVALKTVRDRLSSEKPFDNIIENLRLDIVEAMELFQSLDGIEVHLIKEYVELFRLYSRCIEISGNEKYDD